MSRTRVYAYEATLHKAESPVHPLQFDIPVTPHVEEEMEDEAQQGARSPVLPLGKGSSLFARRDEILGSESSLPSSDRVYKSHTNASREKTLVTPHDEEEMEDEAQQGARSPVLPLGKGSLLFARRDEIVTPHSDKKRIDSADDGELAISGDKEPNEERADTDKGDSITEINKNTSDDGEDCRLDTVFEDTEEQCGQDQVVEVMRKHIPYDPVTSPLLEVVRTVSLRKRPSINTSTSNDEQCKVKRPRKRASTKHSDYNDVDTQTNDNPTKEIATQTYDIPTREIATQTNDNPTKEIATQTSTQTIFIPILIERRS